MKKILSYLILCIPAFVFLSCEKDMEVYHAQDNDRLNFVFKDDADTLVAYTFIYCPESQLTDTIWMEVQTSGYVTDYAREITLAQLPVDSNAAVAGTHYIGFNDPSMASVYVIPANQSKVTLPLVVKRDDPALENKEFILRIGFQENKYFKPGFLSSQERTVKISNILTRPKNWSGYATYYFTGKYGKVKHRFMIDAGAEKGVTVDENFFYDLVGDPNNVDMGLTDYWNGFFVNALQEENALRASQGLGPLREAPKAGETEGMLVEFNKYDSSDF